MLRRLASTRFLPVTIAVMAVLLASKSTMLVRGMWPAVARAEAAEKPAEHAAAEKAGAHKAPAEKAPGEKVGAEKAGAEKKVADKPAAVAAPAEPAVTEGERALLLDLRQRRTELDARAAALASQEAVMSATAKRLDGRVQELTTLQTRLEGLEKTRADRDEANWAGLVKLYETMKPRDAAVIFNDLDMPVLLGVVGRMKESRAAPVLAAMQPERARQITAALAQQRSRGNAAPGPVDKAGGG